MKRFIALLLLASILVSCGSGSEKGNDTTTSDDTTTAPEETVSSEEASLPSLDLGGKSITILVPGTQYGYFEVEEQSGDIVDDAIWQARQNVNERLNCEINYMRDPGDGDWERRDETINYVTSTVMADSDELDALDSQSYMSIYLVKGLLMDMGKLKYIDIDNPWWDKSITETISLDGKYPFIAGSYSLGRTASAFCIYFNKTIASNLNLPDLYQLVYDGGWTLDKLQEYSEMAYIDLDGNGEVNKGDQFGMVFEGGNFLTGFYVTLGMKALDREDDKFVVSFDNSHNVEIVDSLKKLLKVKGVYHDTDAYTSGYSAKDSIFTQGNTLFNGGLFEYAGYYRNLGFEYGILPYPKYSESDTDYVTSSLTTFGLLGIPKSNHDADNTSAILECLSYEYYKNVIPTYYETAMKIKYSSDNETANMLDFIIERLSYEAGLTMSGSLDYLIDGTYKDCIISNGNWTTTLAKIKNQLQNRVDELNAGYDELG